MLYRRFWNRHDIPKCICRLNEDEVKGKYTDVSKVQPGLV